MSMKNSKLDKEAAIQIEVDIRKAQRRYGSNLNFKIFRIDVGNDLPDDKNVMNHVLEKMQPHIDLVNEKQKIKNSEIIESFIRRGNKMPRDKYDIFLRNEG